MQVRYRHALHAKDHAERHGQTIRSARTLAGVRYAL
jgi:hypothetical protein